MAKKRRKHSNDIAVPAPAGGKSSESISVRAIKNGYLISKSGVRRGKYYEETEYSAGRPVIAATGVPGAGHAKPKAASHKRAAGPTAFREVGHLRGA